MLASILFALFALTSITLSAPLEIRQTQCSSIHVLFARGTTEPGTLGTVVGPRLSRALSTAAGRGVSTEVEGIPYPAVVAGFLAGGDRGGARTMASRVQEIAQGCPDTKIVLSGYSQGAQVAHLAAQSLSAADQARVASVVTFGDPKRDTALPGDLENRRLTICNRGDLICEGRATVLAPHLTYGRDVGDAARFIVENAQ